jgi:hypothetical protein
MNGVAGRPRDELSAARSRRVRFGVFGKDAFGFALRPRCGNIHVRIGVEDAAK